MLVQDTGIEQNFISKYNVVFPPQSCALQFAKDFWQHRLTLMNEIIKTKIILEFLRKKVLLFPSCLKD